MATRFYLPSSGSPAVTPSTWNHTNQAGTTYTLPGVRTKGTTALTSRTTATGTTNPYTRAVMRYVIGPLNAQTIDGTVNAVMRCSESNGGANATMSIAVKLIQPDGSDRSVLLAATASDSAASPREFTTTLGSRRAYDVAEARPITLTSRDATAGDYLVIELGFRSATGTSYNVVMQHGDDAATDLDDAEADTGADAPYVDFSDDISLNTEITPAVGSLAAVGLAVGLLLGGPTYPWITPETGALYFGLETAASHTITPPSGSLTAAGVAPALGQAFSITPPTGNLTLAGLAGKLGIAVTPTTGALTAAGAAPSLRTDTRLTPTVGALDFTGSAPALATSGGTNITPDPGALALAGVAPSLQRADYRTPPAGAVVVAGVAPTVLVSVSVQPPTGMLVCTGSAPTVQTAIGTVITPTTGQLFFGVGDSHLVTPPAGALVAAGAAPTAIVSGSNQTISPPTGALAAVGIAPGRVQGTRITPPSGALSLDPPAMAWTWTGTGGEEITSWRFKYGRDAGVYTAYTDVEDETLRAIAVRAVITAGPGWWYVRAYAVGPSGEGSFSNELYVNPGIVTLQVDTPRTPDTGTLTATGIAPSITTPIQTRITPDAGALTATGAASTLFRQDYRTPPAGGLALTGISPALDAPQFVTPPSGALTATGAAPVVGSDRVLAPPAGSLALTGLGPGVDQSTFLMRVITPPTGSLTATGLAPTPRQDARLRPDTGTLTVAGVTPTERQDAYLTPSAGAMTLLGADPQAIIGPVIIPPSGQLDWDADEPTLDETHHETLTPPTGALAIAGAAPSVAQTGVLFEAYRLRELPARYALTERPARYRWHELPPRYACLETDRGVE